MKPCNKCGNPFEGVRCIACKRRYNKTYYKRDPEGRKAQTKQWVAQNKEYVRERREQHYRENRESILEKQRIYARRNGRRLNLKAKFGLSLAQYEAMLIDQLGCCAICLKPFTKVHVDHNHKTGKIRGLLCGRCNCGIGHLMDSPEILRAAASYLEKENTK